MPLVEEYKEKLGKLNADQGGWLTLEKGDDAKDLRRALKAAVASLKRRIRFPFRGEEGSLSFYLEGTGKAGEESEGRGAWSGDAEEADRTAEEGEWLVSWLRSALQQGGRWRKRSS